MTHTRARVVLAGLLVAGTATLTNGSAVAAPEKPAQERPGTAATVTLVTGDLVTLDGERVHAAPGREHIGFRKYTDAEGDLHLVPADAVALEASGKLDPRLFDVTELARTGYGNRKDLPLIVDYPGKTPKVAGAQGMRELPSVGAVAMRAEKSPAFWSSTIASAGRIWLDGQVKATLDKS